MPRRTTVAEGTSVVGSDRVGGGALHVKSASGKQGVIVLDASNGNSYAIYIDNAGAIKVSAVTDATDLGSLT